MPIKILNTLDFVNLENPEVKQLIEKYHLQWVNLPAGTKGKEAGEFVSHEISDAEVLVGWRINSQTLATAKNLKWIHVPFAGVNYLLDSCPELAASSVTLTNGSGSMSGPIGDTVMGYILLFNRRFLDHFRNQQRHEWADFNMQSVTELSQQTLGIVGYGHIGADVAKRAKAFGLRVIASKNNTAGDYPHVDEILSSRDLPRLLAASDYVLLSTPLTPETKGLIGRAELETMKPTAIIMNVGRGQIIKQDELIEALQNKKIGGAALDVTDPEPLPADSPLWDMENVFITPHASPLSSKVLPRMVEIFIKNLKLYLEGQPLVNIVDLQRGY